MSNRASDFDYAAERLIRTDDRIVAAEPLAAHLGDDMTTAWGLTCAVTHHARATLNTPSPPGRDHESRGRLTERSEDSGRFTSKGRSGQESK